MTATQANISLSVQHEQAKVEIGKAQLANRRAREDAAARSMARKVGGCGGPLSFVPCCDGAAVFSARLMTPAC